MHVITAEYMIAVEELQERSIGQMRMDKSSSMDYEWEPKLKSTMEFGNIMLLIVILLDSE